MKSELHKNSKLIGKNLKTLRTISELTLEELAQKVNLTKGFLSQVEKGNRSLKFEDLLKILKVHKFTAGRFFSLIDPNIQKDNKSLPSIVSDFKKQILLDGDLSLNSFSIILLRSYYEDKGVEKLKLFFPPKFKTFDFSLNEGTISGIVTKGELLIDFGQDEYRLKEGDEFEFNSKLKHFYRNYTDNPSELIIFTNPPVI